jgi:4-cresol dehydrogenase (hydroxylating)
VIDRLDQALHAWRQVLGAAHVLIDSAVRAAAQTATFQTTQTIPAILRPATCAEVQECVRIANAYRVPLYPISTGKNWGYGSRVPVTDGCVLLELARLNRILDYDETLGYVTVEPGVTVRQLLAFLREHHSHLTVPRTGSTLDASLVGNALERGLGTGLYADRANHVCAFEVILPNGDCIHTGLARFPTAHAAAVSRWGVGPALEGLFAQANLGIVTRMTLWLPLAPAYLQNCFFVLEDDAGLKALLTALQRLKMAQVCREPVRLFNDLRLLATQAQHPGPWPAGGRPYLAPLEMAAIRRAVGLGAWNGVITLSAPSAAHGQADRTLVTQHLAGVVDELLFVSAGEVETAAARRESPGAILAFFTAPEELGAGGNLHATYWRKPTPPPSRMDPDRDGCGVIWCAPALPFTGAHGRAAVDLITGTFAAYQFEPQISILGLTERNLILVAALVYDREAAGEDARARDCHATLLAALCAAGYLPYRLPIQSMDALPPPRDDYARFWRTLKTALDAQNILAPGRYEGLPPRDAEEA